MLDYLADHESTGAKPELCFVCLSYGDFKFSLHNGEGRLLPLCHIACSGSVY